MDRSQAGSEPGGAPQPVAWRVWSVAGLLLAVSDALRNRLPSVAVRGEISGFSRAASGHCYFNLKDDTGAAAGLRCVMFRRVAGMLDFVPRDGVKVELRGRLEIYEARGELQLVAESMSSVGAGSLFEEFLRLKARLGAEGLFDPGRKRALPGFPRCIALVTSPAGAAVHDVLTTLQRRSPHVRVLLVPAQVQGAAAVASLEQALALANTLAEPELLILCRGGGSLEDLAAFNAEAVVRAVAVSRLPVVAGIGHETDFSLADMVADLRAPTPTAAAEMAVPALADQLERLAGLERRLIRAVQRPLELASQRLDALALRLKEPSRALARQHERLAQTAARLHALDPRQVLARGYTWVEDEAGRPVVSAAGVRAGQWLQAVWADGRAAVTVDEVEVDVAQPSPGESPD